MSKTNLIKLKFLRAGEPSGREYTYISKADVEVGDTVQISIPQSADHEAPKGIVTAVNVPESEVESFKDKLKEIVGKLCTTCETCAELVACGEGDHLCSVGEGNIVLSDYAPTDDYYWCKGSKYRSN